MVRKLFALAVLGLVSSSLGCAMCCSTDDPNYGAYGGRWQRHDMSHGRVGSAFNDAGFDALAEGEEESAEEPASPAEAEAGDDGLAGYAPNYEDAPSYEDVEVDLVTFVQ